MARRQTDADDEGRIKRRMFDAKTVILLLTAILGPGGVVGYMNYTTDPNIQLQNRFSMIQDTHIPGGFYTQFQE